MKTLQIIGLSVLLFSTACQKDTWPCLRSSGDETAETRTFIDADGLIVEGSCDVNLHHTTDEAYVVLSGPQNLVENIKTSQLGGNVRIYNRHCTGNSDQIKVDLYLTRLSHCEIKGSGSVYFSDHFDCENMDLMITGSGDINADVNASNTICKILGSGNVDIEGASSDLDLIINGSGDFEAPAFELATADMKIAGSGNADVMVNSDLKISISGSGHVYYSGNPTLDVEITGSGSTHHRD